MFRLTHALVALFLARTPALAQDAHPHHDHLPAAPQPAEPHVGHAGMDHEMALLPLGRGWVVMGMAQAFPVVTVGAPFQSRSALRETDVYLTQPVAMINVEAPESRLVLRLTPNFEGLTQPDGELTFGAWGEGFIDARHPHTILHEAMLSLNVFEVSGFSLSLSAGKGFAPFGTDDPMARPALKYPTNHHLSQLLERWTVNAIALHGGWGLEAGLFGGLEPHGPYDFSNITSFGDSFSGRLSRRFGPGFGPLAAWEVSASYARVRGAAGAEAGVTAMYNTAVRHAGTYPFGSLYGLVEASLSQPEVDDAYYALLGETLLGIGRHQPYYRIEFATRPEFPREGAGGTRDFFRYDHDAPATGATRWLINTAGYGYRLTDYPLSTRIFVEIQHHVVRAERGGILPAELFGARQFWSVSVGARIFFGGGPMRMGTYGVLDPMTVMRRQMSASR